MAVKSFVVVLALALFSVVNAAVSFSINGNTATPAQYTLIGNAKVDTNSGSFLITNQSQYQVGAIWINQPIKLAAGFNISTIVKITHDPTNTTAGCRTIAQQGNADGIAFVLNAQSTNSYGTFAENLGYNFANNFAIEIDTYSNSAEFDPYAVHIGVQSCGRNLNSANHSGPCKVATPVNIVSCYDNVNHTLTVTYDALAHIVQIYWDNKLFFNFTYNIGANFDLINGDSVYVGFTGSTGRVTSRQEFYGVDYTDLQQIQCPGQLVNYTDNTCYSCPAGFTANFTANKCQANPTAAPTTAAPTTAAPTTAAPTTAAPTTAAPTTAAPTTAAPTTAAPTTAAPTTAAPTTAAPTSSPSTCTNAPVTVSSADQLQAALLTSCNIVLNSGTYGSPTNGNGYVIGLNGTSITAPTQGGATISCGNAPGRYTSLTTVVDSPNRATFLAIGLYIAPSVVDVSVSNVVLQYCQTGVYADFYSESTFNNVLVQNNFNNVGIGSGFHTITTSQITITNSNVTQNTGYAGIEILGTAQVSNTHVDSNSGGAYAARYSAVININGGTANNNYGSGIYAERNSVINATNLVITGNYGSWFGGGVWSRTSSISLQGVSITANSAREGGGIYGELQSTFTISAATQVGSNSQTSGSVSNAYFSGDSTTTISVDSNVSKL